MSYTLDGRPICTYIKIAGFGVQHKCFYPAFNSKLCSYHILMEMMQTIKGQAA